MKCARGAATPDYQTRLRLFADSGGYCQNPACTQTIFVETDSGTIHIAELAHIFAASNQGPRANNALTKEERGAYENLILLCVKCHTLVDKAPESYPDTTLASWKARHIERLASLFGARRFESRTDVREAIRPLLSENKTIFDEYGPHNAYSADPESDLAGAWRRKVRAKILPNNRRILSIADANIDHLSNTQRHTLELFRQHVADLEARHLENRFEPTARFPHEMNSLFEGN